MTSTQADRQPRRGSERPFRVGAVRFLNARPLVFGLEDEPGLSLHYDVPARLAEALAEGRIDVGLVPSIDYQRSDGQWLIVPGAAIASRGEVLTVRVFSRCPLDQVERIACDTDSHTSVALAALVWQLRFGRMPEMTALDGPCGSEATVMLIGDKVMGELGQWAHELDLGQAWTEMTSLPFVYAFWAVRADAGGDVPVDALQRARQQGMAHIDAIVDEYADEHGFERGVARKYLTEHLSFDLGRPEWQGLARFYSLAHRYGLIDQARPLLMCDGGVSGTLAPYSPTSDLS